MRLVPTGCALAEGWLFELLAAPCDLIVVGK